MQKPLVNYGLFSQELKDAGSQAGFSHNFDSTVIFPCLPPTFPGTRLM